MSSHVYKTYQNITKQDFLDICWCLFPSFCCFILNFSQQRCIVYNNNSPSSWFNLNVCWCLPSVNHHSKVASPLEINRLRFVNRFCIFFLMVCAFCYYAWCVFCFIFSCYFLFACENLSPIGFNMFYCNMLPLFLFVFFAPFQAARIQAPAAFNRWAAPLLS